VSIEELPTNLDFTADFPVQAISDAKNICNGSNSHIFKAQLNTKNKLNVIVKKIKSSKALDDVAIDEFTQEKTFLSRSSHPNIVKLYGCGQDMTRPFLIMEFLDGSSLKAILSRQPSLPSRPFKYTRFIDLACQLASALDYLHNGFAPDVTIIHRDLKPDNIAFTGDGTLKVLDFGLCVCIKKPVKSADKKKESEKSPRYRMTGTIIQFTALLYCSIRRLCHFT
jgi:serine/threonine-protein kinase